MRYINHNIRGGSASFGSISAKKLYGINGGEHVYENDASRAEHAVNFIRKSAGSVCKRRGFTKKSVPIEFDGQINAGCLFKTFSSQYSVYLAGSSLYCLHGDVLYTHALTFDTAGMRPFRAGSYLFFAGNRSLIIYRPEINSLMYWSDEGCGGAIVDTYIPTLYIGNTPGGAGASYEGVNLLNPLVCETYQGDGESTRFTTHLEPEGNIMVYVKDDTGEYVRKSFTEYGDMSVTLTAAPPVPSVAGEDNVKIVYRYKNSEYAARPIYHSTCFELFGVGGNRDRVFMSGDYSQPGRVYYSHMDNPLYFCDIDYIKVGDSETDVCSLAYYGSHLAVITDGGIYTVYGADGQDGAIKQDALFLIDGLIASPQPIESEPSLIFGDEPVYLTEQGVYAITASGVLDERCAQRRSARINVLLQKEQLKNCRMLNYGDYLVISNCQSTLYLLDSKQFSADGAEPYATRQYEGYVWTDICAKAMWTEDGVLYFSDGAGIFAFDGGYADERESGVFYPIDACWETPYIYGPDISDIKFFYRLSLLCDGDETKSNVKILARFDKTPWRTVKNYDGSLCVFSYGDFDYSLFTYKSCVQSDVVSKRFLHKKGRGIKLRFLNDRIDEPFTMLRFSIDYMKEN